MKSLIFPDWVCIYPVVLSMAYQYYPDSLRSNFSPVGPGARVCGPMVETLITVIARHLSFPGIVFYRCIGGHWNMCYVILIGFCNNRFCVTRNDMWIVLWCNSCHLSWSECNWLCFLCTTWVRYVWCDHPRRWFMVGGLDWHCSLLLVWDICFRPHNWHRGGILLWQDWLWHWYVKYLLYLTECHHLAVVQRSEGYGWCRVQECVLQTQGRMCYHVRWLHFW